MRQSPLLFFAILVFFFDCHAQGVQTDTLAKKQVSASILGPRTMVVRDPFDANRVLRRLIPGKYYDLGPRFGGHVDRLINWVCPACKPVIVRDVNEMDTAWFPDPGGVATRPLTVFAYTGDGGRQYKLISFNHSWYDSDGMQTVSGARRAWMGNRTGPVRIGCCPARSMRSGISLSSPGVTLSRETRRDCRRS